MEKNKLKFVCSDEEAKGLLKMVNNLPDGFFDHINNNSLIVRQDDTEGRCAFYPETEESIDLSRIEVPKEGKVIMQEVYKRNDGINVKFFVFNDGAYLFYERKPI